MPASWEPKVTAIEEAKQMSTMQMDKLIGNLQSYELKKSEKAVEEPKKERSLSLKPESESDDEEMAMFVQDCPHLKEEQRRNSKRQQQLDSKAFKKVMKATWGETSDEESEVEDGDNDNLALMTKSDTDSDNNSSEGNEDEQHEIGLVPSSAEQVSSLALNEGTLLETDSLNVPS
ncbi:hypothetical protein HAX54_003117 [Datura stramonium]|uniref:Uncharacterized protein n=1 Tax=Datura stramonium TaxID=4076 RepID=A0ABS8T656_DATST|nr:hypothetical protein [Datura stramonium]